MGLITRLSLRNLLRQKRRNILLGIGIAFGMMILVFANSFSKGMVDVLINDIVTNVSGHLTIKGMSKGTWYPLIRDKERVVDVIEEVVGDDLEYIAENLGMIGRAIGNGKVDNAFVVGVEADDEFFTDFLTLIEGSFDRYTSDEIEYPVIVSPEKAESLNVGIDDIIKIRIPMVTGQMQAARLSVIAIAKGNNTFMDMVLFMQDKKVKELLGYKEYESSDIQLAINNPKQNAVKYANQIHERLQPEIISFTGEIKSRYAHLIAFKNSEDSFDLFSEKLEITFSEDTGFDKETVLISEDIASEQNLKIGDKFEFEYETKYRENHTIEFEIAGIISSNGKFGENIIFVNEELIHKDFNRYLPKNTKWDYIENGSQFHSAIATEWKLLERSSDANEMAQKIKRENRIKSDTFKLDVTTMYETASQIIQLEGALNLITMIAVLVLFFIILIGVVNTLRMTIKERTREIGTVRAMGMQKKDVRNTFIMETALLTLFSCIIGTIVAIALMQIIGMIEFNTDSALSIILKNNRINFKLDLVSILFNLGLILFISIATAFFPAKKAAKLSCAEALRHYE